MTDSKHVESELLRDYLSDQLDFQEAEQVEEHLEGCDACRDRLEEMICDITPVVKKLSEFKSSLSTHSLNASDSDTLAEPAECAVEFSIGDRFVIKNELARGGMGVVYLAQDQQLKRDVAIKVVIPSHQNYKAAIFRFRREAMITGQMQHPGVPPVHMLGTLQDGRPFIAMKLVRGKTLRAVMDQQPAVGSGKLLEIFSQVCKTMAYSHAQGIIHRDLKPDNIMIGTFGQVMIMDWGLAKKMSANAESAHDDHDDIGEELPQADTMNGTRFGSVMGTPAYMSPEQALGLPLDKRADVFSLGGILYEILTGSPPVDESSETRDVNHPANKDVEKLYERLDTCQGDPALIRLARQCLTQEAEQRLPDGEAVNDQLNDYLHKRDESLRQSEIEREQTAQKLVLERKRRKQVTILGATIAFVLICTVFAIFMYLAEKNARLANRMTRETRIWQSLKSVDRIQNKAQESNPDQKLEIWTNALIQIRQAGAMIDDSLDPGLVKEFKLISARVERKAAEANDLKKQQALDEQMIAAVENAIEVSQYPDSLMRLSANKNVLLRISKAFGDYDIAEFGDIAAATRIINSSKIRSELLLGLRFWRTQCERLGKSKDAKWIAQLANSADPNPLRAELRDLYRQPNRERIREIASKPESLNSKLSAMLTIDCLQKSKASPSVLPRFLESAYGKWPDDFEINFACGNSRGTIGNYQGALHNFSACLSMQPHNPGVLINLSAYSNFTGDYQRGIDYALQVSRLVPEFPHSYVNLAAAFHSQGKLDTALKYCDQALEFDSDFAKAHFNRSVILADMKRLDEALVAIDRAIEFDVTNVEFYLRKSFILQTLKKYDQALAVILAAEKNAPDNKFILHHMAIYYRNIGQKEKSVETSRKLLKLHPGFVKGWIELSYTLTLDRKFKQAQQTLTDASKSGIDDFGLLGALANIRSAQGRFEETLLLLRLLSSARPEMSEAARKTIEKIEKALSKN